ncbi:MAG: Ig-like domain-containing protein [Euryarchaeota archaeon]|nr:Ig-like domain-containing protein [Euryarchaeota archaeon]MBU4339423.1 Ig-like domain-containing protein [Euryarchaeota archaeon]MBU4454127.1 Ig-like domain-containing protein [Euryarchaeota archaeon]MCG2736461.1 Ig-like domain-containing protein [Candidatus Methanoperedenaceae archaeon]
MASLKNPKLEFQLDDSEMIQNNYSLLKLIIINTGELEAKDISIKLQTEIEASKNSKLEVNHEDFPRILGEIKPGERKEIHFEFRPITAGRASLTILNSCKTAQGKCLLEKKDVLYVTIQQEISKPSSNNQSNLNADFERYRKQATALYSKGKNITDSERGMLDVIRITCNLTKEQQKQIENEIIKKQKEENIVLIEVVDESGKPIKGIFVRVKESLSGIDLAGNSETDINGIAKFTLSRNRKYTASVSALMMDYVIPGDIAITPSDTVKRITLKKKEGMLEITVTEQGGKLFAGIPVTVVRKGTNQVMQFISDNNGKINQKVLIGDYTVKINPSASQLYDISEKQVTALENKHVSIAIALHFNYQPKNETITAINKYYDKLNNSFIEVSACDRCIPLFLKSVGEAPLKLIERIIKRPVDFLDSKTTPDEIINNILSAEEIISEEISRIMREKSNVDFYSIIQNLPQVEDLVVSDYSQNKFSELIHDISNYYKNHFREIGNKLFDIHYELTQLSGTLTMHPVADLCRVAQKLRDNCNNEPDVKKRGVMFFINDKLLDHVREMYTKEEVKARLEFSSPHEASLIINRAKKHLEKAKSESYAVASIIDDLEHGLDKLLRKLSLSAQGIDEVKDAYKAKDYTKAAEAAGALIQKIESLINSSRPSLVPQLKIANFKLGAGRKTQIIIHNEGTTPATNVSSEISGDITIRVLSKLELLNPGESKPIEVWIKPTVEGDLPLDVLLKYSDVLNRNYEDKRELWIGVGETATQPLNAEASDKIEIKRGFGLLPNNDIRLGIRIKNGTGYAIMDVEILLDFNNTLFSLRSERFVNLGNLHPGGERTGKYILKPLDCIHNEQINALITYKDHTGKKQTLHMRPKEVHSVCPFLKEKPMSEGEYSRLAANSEFVQEGISFKDISVEDLVPLMGETCRHMLYKVKEYDLEYKKVIYLSGEAIGEKAYYLLTAVVLNYKGLTQVVLRAHSDKKYGLNGFMSEMADNIRHLVGSVQNAKEIGIIENTQVINIIDSVVQRTSFNMGEGGSAQVNIRESVVQRTNIGDDQRKNEF